MRCCFSEWTDPTGTSFVCRVLSAYGKTNRFSALDFFSVFLRFRIYHDLLQTMMLQSGAAYGQTDGQQAFAPQFTSTLAELRI